MHLVLAQILGLGKAPSSFGVTLALIITWVICVAGLVVGLMWFISRQGRVERDQDLERAAEFDARHAGN